jgi:hypothetical protein
VVVNASALGHFTQEAVDEDVKTVTAGEDPLSLEHRLLLTFLILAPGLRYSPESDQQRDGSQPQPGSKTRKRQVEIKSHVLVLLQSRLWPALCTRLLTGLDRLTPPIVPDAVLLRNRGR